MKNTKLLAHFALMAVAIIYGLNYILAKDVMPKFIEPRAFILARVVGATALFWLLSLFFKQEVPLRKDFIRIAMSGFFGVAANQILIFEGLNLTTPINASVMMTMNPIMVLLLSAIFLKEPIKLARIIGIILGLFGAIYLISKGSFSMNVFDSDNSTGNLLVLGNAAAYAAYLVIVKPLMQRYKPLTVIKYVFTFGLFYVIPIGWNQFEAVQWMDLPSYIIFEIAFVVVFTTFFAYLLNIFALKTVSSTTVSFYIYLQPIITSIVALSLGKDQLGHIIFISAGLIFSGVYLVSFYKR